MAEHTSSCPNQTDVEGFDNSVEIAAGGAANGADASFATDRNVKWSQSCAEGEEVSVNNVLVSAGAKGSQQAEVFKSRQPCARGGALTDSADTGNGRDS